MQVAWFPKTADLHGNPYWSRLQSELEQFGVQFSKDHPSYWLTRSWLLRNRHTVSVLHFHFIQPFYVGDDDGASFRRLLRFASDLLLARLLGYHLVWTVHDLMPTWPKEPRWVERWARYLIAHFSHDVIVHCQAAKQLVSQHFKRKRRVHVLPLPNYADIHPNNMQQAEARSNLELPHDAFIVGFVGGLRENKGLETLIRAFQAWDQASAHLLIAGNVGPPTDYGQTLKQIAGNDERIHIRAAYIPDAEIQCFLHAADVLVFPFERVLTSSSVMLAMSFGKPVIVPAIGCLPELVSNETGLIYLPQKSSGLTDALRQARQADLTAMGKIAAQRVGNTSWKMLAKSTEQIYRKS